VNRRPSAQKGCDHSGPATVERVERGYCVRSMVCEKTGPTRKPPEAARKAASASVPYMPPGPPFGPWLPETDETSRHLPHRYLLTSVNRGEVEEGVVGVISALVTYVYRVPGEPPAVLIGTPPGSDSV
jgi:hypothetical protein